MKLTILCLVSIAGIWLFMVTLAKAAPYLTWFFYAMASIGSIGIIIILLTSATNGKGKTNGTDDANKK